MPKSFKYDIGDTVVYSPFGGGERRIIVEEKESDIKNGRPGFAGGGYWGYDSQIIRVIPKTN